MDSLQLAFGRPRSSACKICELSFSFLPFLWCWTPCFLLTMCTHTHINVIYIYIHTYTHNLAENEQPREGGSAGNKRSKCASSDHPPSQSFTYQFPAATRSNKARLQDVELAALARFAQIGGVFSHAQQSTASKPVIVTRPDARFCLFFCRILYLEQAVYVSRVLQRPFPLADPARRECDSERVG
jgi:hypothetical protein